MGKIKKLLANPFRAYDYAAGMGLTNWVPDEIHLKLMYRAAIGSWPDMKCPNTFNEKLQWLKLHDRNPLYTILADKYRVKEWVAERIGAEHVAKTYGVWEKAEDVDISGLPERFVLKTNHDCGGVIICHNRDTFDIDMAKRTLDKHLNSNYYWRKREWAYKDIGPLVFAEEYLGPDSGGNINDYKLFRFSNGRIVALLMTDRFTGAVPTETFFDETWRPLNLTEGGHPRRCDAPAPTQFEEMKRLADIIGRGFPFARVDFYEVEDRLLFGEITFYPNAGFEHFDPPEWDERLGSWIDLSGAYGPVEDR